MHNFYKTIIVFTLTIASIPAMAQEETSTPKPYPSFAGFVTNKFWDNWEISADFGTGFASFSSGNLGGYGDRFGLNGELSVTKWLHPVVGIRGQLMGGNYHTVHPTGGKTAWNFMFAHIDIVSNFSNWIGGYKEDRVYYAIPFAGMGLFASNRHTINYAFTAGLLSRFRVCPSVDINLEIKGILGMSSLNPVSYSPRGRFLGTGNVSVGVTYRFGKRDYVRPAADCSAENLKYLKEAAEAAQKEALAAKAAEDNLKTQLAESQKAAENARQQAEQAAQDLADLQEQHVMDESTPEQCIFFNNGAVLSESEKLHLSVIADQIKSSTADRTYTVCGYADFSTGSYNYNIQLAELRARTVYNYLIGLGVPAERMTHQGMGRDAQPFTARGNQVVIIK